MLYHFGTILFALIAVHYIADFPLQGEFLSQAKNHTCRMNRRIWPHALLAHAMIHGAGVLLVTGSLLLATIEVIAHSMIDFTKCDGVITFAEDQYAHIAWKVFYALAVIAMPH